jgi:glycosyltransferase involved in cell wall biosynthesis
MRFQWIANHVNSDQSHGFFYELYRPWRRYQAVVFLKSMGTEFRSLVHRLKNKGIKTAFDLNVDYLTPSSGTFYYQGMAPSEEQHIAAVEMASLCDGVIADSSYLAKVAVRYNNRVAWIPDNIRPDLIRGSSNWRPTTREKINLLWSGEACKLFELLRIQDVLIEYSSYVHLKLVTNSLDGLSKWIGSLRDDFRRMLDKVSYEIIPFTTIERLMEVYSAGGVCIAPRFLDNTYNQGHTEWKITLAMARGRIVLCSEVPSYVDVFERAKGVGIRICRNDEEWRVAFQEVISSDFDWEKEQTGAAKVVEDYYSTEVVAQMHADFLNEIL